MGPKTVGAVSLGDAFYGEGAPCVCSEALNLLRSSTPFLARNLILIRLKLLSYPQEKQSHGLL